ncbi:MAG: ATP-binding protein [Bdellovibrionales bacterium]
MSLEVDALGRAMNKMAGQLKKRLQQITDDKMQKDIILSSLSEGVLAVSNHGKIIEMNHIAHKIFEVPIDQPYEGRRVQEVIRVPEIDVFVQTALDKNVAYEQSIKLLSDNRYLFLNLKSRPLVQPSGEKTGIVIVITDVTKMKKLENLRKDFVANVSHELRTPLTSIQGYAETLINSGDEMPPDMQKKFIATIYKHSSGLESMVNDLLELSRMENESNLGNTQFEPIDVQEVFTEIKGRYQDLAAEKKVRLEFQDSSAEVQGLRGLLVQALSNLITNAIYYTPAEGSVKIHLSEEGGFYVFHVEDTGVGIDKRHIPRLFERFYRVDEARNRREGGSGLGLAIVKHIALVHAGEVTVESQVGKGSHFRLKIPRRK